MKKVIMIAVVAVMCGGQAYAVEFTDLAVNPADINALAVADGITVPTVSKGYVAPVPSARPIEWVVIKGGNLMMGTNSMEPGFEDARPPHRVTIETFEMSKTDVTVAQYAECVRAGQCIEPGTGPYCNWGKPGRHLHPVNCVDWYQANQYARFKEARLPSEAEWEYAATSGGRNQKYPWGNAEPTRDRVVSGDANGTRPVCSKPAGNTAQGLCDMAGNVWQWVHDRYRDSYAAVEDTGEDRVVRGGSFGGISTRELRCDNRNSFGPDARRADVGFRLISAR